MHFSTREFSNEHKVASETNVYWVPVNTQIWEEVVYKVQVTDLELQDTYY